MSKAFLHNSSGAVSPFAVIGLSFPEGSTISCTGKTTGKTLKIKSAGGRALLNVPAADTWNIVSQKDGKSKSQSVSITAKYQCEKVSILYSTQLFPVPSGETDVTGGWTRNIDKGSTLEIEASSVNYQADTATANTNKAVDLSKFSKILFSVKSVETDPEVPGTAEAKIYLSTTTSVNNKIREANVSSAGNIQFDISDLSGSYYILLYVLAGSMSDIYYKTSSFTLDSITLE